MPLVLPPFCFFVRALSYVRLSSVSLVAQTHAHIYTFEHIVMVLRNKYMHAHIHGVSWMRVHVSVLRENVLLLHLQNILFHTVHCHRGANLVIIEGMPEYPYI